MRLSRTPLHLGGAIMVGAVAMIVGYFIVTANRDPYNAMLDQLEERMLTEAPPETDVDSPDPRLVLVAEFARLVTAATSEEAAAIQSRLPRYLASNRPVLIHAALNALSLDKGADPATIEATLAQLLQSDNPAIVAIAIRKGQSQFHMENQPEIKRLILETPFRPELYEVESKLTKMSPVFVSLYPQGGYGADDRHRAATLLASLPDVITAHCEVLLMIIAQGEAAAKQAALSALISTQDAAFASCTGVVAKSMREGLFGKLAPTADQVAVLLDRSDLVPTPALRGYWRHFFSTPEARAYSGARMKVLAQERLAAAQQSVPVQPDDVRQMEWLLKDLAQP